MVAKLLWKPLTFWDEMQITYINKEEEKIKEYENLSIDELEKMRKELDKEIWELELDKEIWELELDIHYHESEISDLELEKEEKEEELQNIEKALELR